MYISMAENWNFAVTSVEIPSVQIKENLLSGL
jgi:hypothetical protein